jgi:subtilase family serine protease
MFGRKTTTTLACAAAVIAGTGVASATAPAGPSWVATHTLASAFRGTDVRDAPASRRMVISVALGLRDRAGLIQRIEAISTPGSAQRGRVMSPAQVRARYSPTAAQAEAVRTYLLREGFHAVSIAPDRLLVSGVADVAVVERAFDTHIADMRVAGQQIYANTRPASVPASLASTVTAVLGLSSFQMSFPSMKSVAAAASSAPAGITPMALVKVYGAATLPAARRTNIAIYMGGDPNPTLKILRYAEQQWRQRKVPVTVEYGEGRLADANDNPMTGSGEWDLDTQMSTMVAGGPKRLYIYDGATFADPDVARAINQFVSDDKALSMSVSLGECDAVAFLDGTMTATDNMLAEGAAQGQSMFAGTGDNAFTCPIIASTGFPTGPPGVSWPSDGEFTTAVGGTSLSASSSGDVKSESAWDGGGGGISPYETAPPWTLRANVAGQTWQENNYGGRGVPDVSAAATGSPQILIYQGQKEPGGIAGTSVSGPIVNGLWARILQADGGRLGLATPNFYALYNKVNPGFYQNEAGIGVYAPAAMPLPVAGFRDITSGNNFLYPARAGYDYATGIGVLDSARLAALLRIKHKG